MTASNDEAREGPFGIMGGALGVAGTQPRLSAQSRPRLGAGLVRVCDG
jgi:hypothetical protein